MLSKLGSEYFVYILGLKNIKDIECRKKNYEQNETEYEQEKQRYQSRKYNIEKMQKYIRRQTKELESKLVLLFQLGEDIEVFELDVNMSILDGSLGILPRRLMVRREDHFIATSVLTANDIDLGQ